MIRSISSYIAGNACRIDLDPPEDAVRWRVLRNLDGVFADENAPTSIYEGVETTIIDNALVNGQTYFYRPFYFDGADWLGADVASVAIASTYIPKTTDPLLIVRDRLEAGLESMRSAHLLPLPNPVLVKLSSPPIEPTLLPIITVHVASDAVAGQFVGEWDDTNPDRLGWQSTISVQTVAHCLNGDERALLRRAVRAVLMANLNYFADQGFLEIQIQQTDHEDFDHYNIPLYQSQTVLSFMYEDHLSLPETPVLHDITFLST